MVDFPDRNLCRFRHVSDRDEVKFLIPWNGTSSSATCSASDLNLAGAMLRLCSRTVVRMSFTRSGAKLRQEFPSSKHYDEMRNLNTM